MDDIDKLIDDSAEEKTEDIKHFCLKVMQKTTCLYKNLLYKNDMIYNEKNKPLLRIYRSDHGMYVIRDSWSAQPHVVTQIEKNLNIVVYNIIGLPDISTLESLKNLQHIDNTLHEMHAEYRKARQKKYVYQEQLKAYILFVRDMYSKLDKQTQNTVKKQLEDFAHIKSILVRIMDNITKGDS